jgi:hypothetical protein
MCYYWAQYELVFYTRVHKQTPGVKMQVLVRIDAVKFKDIVLKCTTLFHM